MADAPSVAPRNRRSEIEKAQGLARIHRTGYSFEGLDDDRLWRSTPWHKPDILKARDYYKAQLFQQGEASLFWTNIRDLNSLGVGLSLHFRLLKYLVGSILLHNGGLSKRRTFFLPSAVLVFCGCNGVCCPNLHDQSLGWTAHFQSS